MNIQLIKKIIILLLGLTSISLGASVFILSNIGSDPFNVLMQGLSEVWGVTIGQSNIIVSFVYAGIIFIVDRRYIRIGTLIAVIALGSMIDLFIYFLTPLFSLDLHFSIRLISMVTGSTFISFGVAIVYSAKIGMVPNDALPLIISNKSKLPFKWVRISYDLTAVTVGAMLGGVFGIGTLIGALITGPLIALFMQPVESVTDRVLGVPAAIKKS